MKKRIKILACSMRGVWTPINYFLKLSHHSYGQSKNDYEWLMSKQFSIDGKFFTDEEIKNFANDLVNENIDILCLSVYSWNNLFFKNLTEIIKQINDKIIVIAGGPDLDAHKNEDFFKEYSSFDYVVYGDGEKGFTLLLDHMAGYETNLVNVVTKDGTVYPHEVLKERKILDKSPYIEYKDELIKDFNEYKNSILEIKKIGVMGDVDSNIFMQPAILWETTKGCPYKCTFCDWSSGLHNKVRFWGIKNSNKEDIEPNWKKELDFFTEHDVGYLYWNNPNVGLSPQDEEIVNYWCNLKNNNKPAPRMINLQQAKNNKEKTYALWEKFYQAKLIDVLKVSLQDLDPVVLDNIDRPEIPWDEHKDLIKRLLNKYPEFKNTPIGYAEFIWGLPGQTLEHWDRNFLEARELFLHPRNYLFEILVNTPANIPEYREKFQIKSESLYSVTTQLPKKFNLEDRKKVCGSYDLVVSSYSFDKKTWYTGAMKGMIYMGYKNLIDSNPYLYVEKFHLFSSVIDAMYEDFLKHKMIIGGHDSHYFLDININKLHKFNIQRILFNTIYKK